MVSSGGDATDYPPSNNPIIKDKTAFNLLLVSVAVLEYSIKPPNIPPPPTSLGIPTYIRLYIICQECCILY